MTVKKGARVWGVEASSMILLGRDNVTILVLYGITLKV
jgi:hypothetical protein